MNTTPKEALNIIEDDNVEKNVAPSLWNPLAAVWWSLLLTPIFGSIIHMKNWQTLGETEKATKSKVWLIFCTAFFAFRLLIVVIVPKSKVIDLDFRIAATVLLIAWYFFSAYPQMKFITERFNGSYVKKGWLKPISYLLLILITIFFWSVVIVSIVNPNFGEE